MSQRTKKLMWNWTSKQRKKNFSNDHDDVKMLLVESELDERATSGSAREVTWRRIYSENWSL